MFRTISGVMCALLLCFGLAASAMAAPPEKSVRLGEFGLAKGVKGSLGGGMAVGTARYGAPGQSFPALLRQDMAVALGWAQSEEATAVLSAEIVEGHANMLKGHVDLGLTAEFVLTRDGAEIFRKRLAVSELRKRDIGGAAVAAVHFAKLFPALSRKLVEDPDFNAALKPN